MNEWYGSVKGATMGQIQEGDPDKDELYYIVIDRIEGSKSLVKIVSETEMPFEK